MPVNLTIPFLPYQKTVFQKEHPGVKFLIITKGRRLGLTKGAAHAFIEWGLDEISPLLWVDTINGNIDRYFDRYFRPILKQLPNSWWKWNQQKKEFKIRDAIIDFRSADAPQSIEGFGYKKIFLNEAGIILKDDYLYSNSILPMLLDYPDSQLIAGGVPKGKTNKDGTPHKFFELFERAKRGEPGYKLMQFTTFDNPIIHHDDIKLLTLSMNQNEINQEINGEFVEYSGDNPFATQFSETDHVSDAAIYDPNKRLHIIMDFNINPFCVIFKHNWQDSNGFHSHQFDEAEIKNGSIPAMITLIKERYAKSLPNCILTGDVGGKRGDLSQADNASYFKQLKTGLKLRDSQLKMIGNPTHDVSRAECNYLLFVSQAQNNVQVDWKINPKCIGSIRDLKIVQCDAYGGIIKSNRKNVAELADFLDCVRYDTHTFWKHFIEKHQKGYYHKK